MSKLNKDVLLLIFEELNSAKKHLYSCLLVNRTWCEITVPILWKNPWVNKKELKKMKSQYNVIISHLSRKI